MRDCNQCGGTGKLKTIAVIGPVPSLQAALDVVGTTAPGDVIVTGNDFVQCAASQFARTCRFMPGTPDAQLRAAADGVVDFAAHAEPKAPEPELAVVPKGKAKG